MKADRALKRIYFDSAATSLQKPAAVYDAAACAMRSMASPGRGGHKPAMLAAETVWRCRSVLAELFGVRDPERVVFTMNATHGLNIALRTLLDRGDRVVVSGYEHNAVMRTLEHIGARIDVARAPLFDRAAVIESYRACIEGAKAAVLCHISNVFGFIQPLEEIAALCREARIPLVVDASQSAGCLHFDFDGLGLRFAAMPGHKGLLGPQGTGVLLCSEPVEPLLTGGTGSESKSPMMPAFLPDRLEAGTHNVPGIAGLLAGAEWIREKRTERILRHEQKLVRVAADQLARIPRVRSFLATDASAQAGLLSFAVAGVGCETVAELLSEANVAVRAGYHCAPLAHRSGGTGDEGTVRFSFSPFNSEREVLLAADRLDGILKKIRN